MRLLEGAALGSILLSSGISYALPTSVGASPVKRLDPFIVDEGLQKRADPAIGDGIDVNDPYRGGRLVSDPGKTNGAFSQAKQLMNYAVTLPASAVDPIFNKYFNPGDKTTVLAVFNKLLGTDKESGAAELANINVVLDKNLDEGDGQTPAELKEWDTANPTLALSDDAFVNPNRDDNPDACATWADEHMSADMYLLGSVLLHE